MSKTTYVNQIKTKLETLKVNESFDKKSFIIEFWRDYDYFIDRTFSVAFANAKNQLPTKVFQTIRGQITRTK